MIVDKCNACHEWKFFVRKRSYICKKVSPKPITSQGKLCGKCFKRIKKLTQ